MKKQLLRPMLVALLSLFGVNTWAAVGDVKTNADIDFSNAITDGAVAGTVNQMTIGTGGADSYIQDGWLRQGDHTNVVTIPESDLAGNRDVVKISFKKAWGNKNSMGSGFAIKDLQGEIIAKFQYARWDGKSTNSNTLGIDMGGLVGSHNSNKPILERYTSFDISIDYATKLITTVVTCMNPSATKTFTASMTNTNPVASFESFGYGVGGNTDRADAFDDLKITTTEGNYNVESATYTVNYVCDGTIIKTAERTGDVDSPISLTVEDKSDQVIDGVKYIYVSDDVEEKTVAGDGSTVVTVTFRKAATWSYAIKAVEGENVLGILSLGTVIEGDAVSFGYPQYYAVDGTLYQSAKQNANPWWGMNYTPTADNAEQTINYTKLDLTNIVFCKEAEDIETLTKITGGNTDIRASNRAGAYAASDAVITTLEPGKYILYSALYGNAGTTYTFKAGEATILELSTNGNPVHTASEEFELYAQTDIIVPQAGNGGNSPKVIDYIIIQKTGDVEMPVIEPAYGEIWSGTKAFPVEEYDVISLNTAYFKDFVQAGDVIKVTLQPAAEEARAEAPMRDIKRFGELALLAADESIIAENGEVALDTEDYSFTVEESWIEKLSTGNNIYLRGRNLTVTKIELLEAVFEPVDCTAKVSTENWLSEQGSVGGPVTLEGIAQKEQYNASTTAVIEGDVLYQTVEGLDNGTYSVELYANASYTSGRGFTSDIIDGELGRIVVYAGDVDKTIPVFDQGWVNTNNIVTLENVVVSDGTLRMGLKKIAPGTNWHTIQIKSLTQVSNKAEADADAQDTYWKGIAATVAAYEAYANVAGSEKAAIVAAETKAAAQAAIPPFYAAKPSYDALAEIIAKANSADYDVTEAEALMANAETTAEQAAAKAAELLHPVTLAVNTKAVEGASKDNPIETNFVTNGTFDTAGVIAPWKTTTGAQNQTTANNQSGAFGIENSFFFENWNPDPFTGKMYQVIEDIPNGLYILKIAAFVNTFDATAQYVYANTDQTPLTTGNPTAYEVQTNVTTNTIEIGLEQIVAVANWMGVDNVSLIYKGDGTATSINEVTAKQNTGNAIYNLQGQKVQNTRKGLYIINGKKVMK